MSTSIPPTNISFSDIRNAAANAGIASDPDSGLGEGWPEISISALRGKTLEDGNNVPSGSNAISLKDAFRGKSFDTTQTFSHIVTLDGTGSSNIYPDIGDEYICIFFKDGSVDVNNDNATITFNGTAGNTLYEVINNGGEIDASAVSSLGSSNSFPSLIVDYSDPGQYGTDSVWDDLHESDNKYPWRLTSGSDGENASVWTSTCGINPVGDSTGTHNAFSYIKFRIGLRSSSTTTFSASNKPSSININASSEAGWDWIKVWKKSAPRYGNRGIYRLTLTDSTPNGWNHISGAGVNSFMSIDRTEGSTDGTVANAKQSSSASVSDYNTYISKTAARQVPFFITEAETGSPFPLTITQLDAAAEVNSGASPNNFDFENMSNISSAARSNTRVTIPHPNNGDGYISKITMNVILGAGKHVVFILADDYSGEIGWYIEHIHAVNDTTHTATKLYEHTATTSGWTNGSDLPDPSTETRDYRYFTSGAYSDSSPGTYSFQIN